MNNDKQRWLFQSGIHAIAGISGRDQASFLADEVSFNSGQRPYSSRRTQDETDRAGSLGCHRADSKQPYSDPSPATARTPTTKAERSHNPAQARSDRWRTDSPIAASGLPVQAAGLLPQTTVPNNDCDNDHAARDRKSTRL